MFESYVEEAMRRGRRLPQRRIRLTATDGVTLFAGLFEPDEGHITQHVVILYHGAGANMNVGYLDLAHDIHAHSGVTVVVPDVRGHGMSKGPRGYAADRKQVWTDIDSWITHVEQLWPGADITLMGHSAGAIQCLNRITEADVPLRESVTRFIAIAPYFASTARLIEQSGVDLGEFELPKFSHRMGLATKDGDCPESCVVNFNFPAEAAKWCNLVSGYTAEMSAALSPREIDRQLAALNLPTQVFAAEEDELFPVEGLRQLVADANNPLIQFTTIAHAHLSCLFYAGPQVAKCLALKEEAA